MSALLEIRNLSAGYGRLPVLHEVSLTVAEGQVVCVIGPNGAGKTTLLRVLSGLIPPWSGLVTFRGQHIAGLPAERTVRLGIAHVPQDRHVFPAMTVRENLVLGATALQGGRASSEAVRLTSENWMERFPILGKRADQLAGVLSGGEQQILVICRALMADPSLILMDEPSLGLSPSATDLCFELIDELRRQGRTILLVEQDGEKVQRLVDSMYEMGFGVLREVNLPPVTRGGGS